MHVTIPVELGERAYSVDIYKDSWAPLAAGLAKRVGSSRVFFVTDTEVAKFWKMEIHEAVSAAGVNPIWIEIPDGEQHKTPDTWLDIVTALTERGVQRSSWIVAIGGGVVGDMAGFAAASVLRGVRWVQVPTTLLAMVDASVGGKTALNLPAGKNLLGAFHQPSWVCSSLHCLGTLSQKEFRSGLGEVLKMAVLEGSAFWTWLYQNADALYARSSEALLSAIEQSVALKARIVSGDEREAGDRVLLNAGHTLGHALESALGFGTLTHGEAVALGLLHECRYAVTAGVCVDPSLVTDIEEMLRYFDIDFSAGSVDPEDVKSAIFLDKKSVGNKIKVPLPSEAGDFTVKLLNAADIDVLVRTLFDEQI